MEILKNYLEDIAKTFRAGDATEVSYYSALKKLLEDYLESKHQKPSITVVPKKTKVGIPDFTIRKHRELVGNIEAKDITTKNLSDLHESEQIERYRNQIRNFILTNFLDFQLFRDGELKKEVRIAQPAILKRLKTAPPPQNEEAFFELLDLFFDYSIPEVKTAKALASELAHRAQHLMPYLVEELTNRETDEIDRIFEAFKKHLIPDLSVGDFADIYAQTITYGLFTARLNYDKGDFNRFVAADYIPKNLRIFHDTFSLISSNALPQSIDWIVDDIAAILKYCDIQKIREDLHKEKAGGDPIMHFYETFLAEYDPKKRKSRGVYYTPLPVVSYITRSVNILLKEKFNKKTGFADKSVTLLDPASGTLTFLAQAITLAKEEVDKGKMSGAWQQIVKSHILKNFYAFELLMAPYIIGHLKISLLLEDLGYKITNDDRFPLYLTNTLDFRDIAQAVDPYVAALSEEAIEAKRIKGDVPILAVMGNPPYSFSHSEQSEFVKNTIKDYLTGLGVEKEKKKGVMQDDYIRFLRFAHWKIEKIGSGIVGMITNNSYLDGIIHRAMRKKLLDDFDEIYILNLHGNYRIKEKTPKGTKDENVFDIQQGVAIVILVKTGENKEHKLFYNDLWGLREEKYDFLLENNIKTTKWVELTPQSNNYFFVRKDFSSEDKYLKFSSLKDIFYQNGSGVITRRDEFAVAYTKDELERRMKTFSDKNLPKKFIEESLHIQDTYEWDLEKTREIIRKDSELEDKFSEYMYRLFDKRWIIYHDALVSRTSVLLKESLFNKKNLALITTRILSSPSFAHVFISEIIGDICFLSNRGKETNYYFPLYLYQTQAEELFKTQPMKPNITEEISALLKQHYNKRVSPEDILYYIYAVLYSNTYRKKYNEFLKIDFPRIPFTKDYEVFKQMAKLGEELVELHLLRAKKLDKSIAKFPAQNSCKVQKREYKEKEQRIYINEKQYFSGVTKEVWNYYIGSYQVLDKWLKERIERTLNDDDIAHFLKVITALSQTIELQKQIDKIYPKVEKNLI